jgi:IS30 family transposase
VRYAATPALPTQRSGDALSTAKRLAQGRGQLRDTLQISQRPPAAADRAVPGHWEGDLVIGQRPSAVRPRSSAPAARCCCSRSQGCTAERLRPALTAAVLGLPQRCGAG